MQQAYEIVDDKRMRVVGPEDMEPWERRKLALVMDKLKGSIAEQPSVPQEWNPRVAESESFTSLAADDHDLLKTAKTYVEEHGWSVVPVLPGGKGGGFAWKDYQTRKPTTEELDEWFGPEGKYRDWNIGLVLGAVSGVCAIDDDLCEQTEPLLDLSDLPTPTILSGRATEDGRRNRHELFQYREGVRRVPLANGRILKGEGHIAVLPPSVHANGKAYDWDKRIDASRLGTLMVLPPFATQAVEAVKKTGRIVLNDPTDKVQDGDRHDTWASLAGTMWNAGAAPEIIEAALIAHNETQCQNPKDDAEDEIHRLAFAPETDGWERKSVTVYKGEHRSLRDMLKPISSIDMRPQEWLEKYWLPLGELTVLAGWGDAGKSQIALRIAAQLSKGLLIGGKAREWRELEPSTTIYMSAEDNPETTIKARFRAAGGDPDGDKLYVFATPPGSTVSLPDRVEELREIVRELNSKLVIIDPMLAFVPMAYDSHRDQDTRNVLAPLTELAQTERLAIKFIMHLNKGSESTKMISRLSGSTAWGNAARAAWGVGHENDAGEDSTYLLYQMKHNLGPPTLPRRYRLVPDVFFVDGSYIETSHVDIIGDAEDADIHSLLDGGEPEDKTLTEELKQAYHDLLKDGPMLQQDIFTITERQMGILSSKGTKYSAKRKANIASIKEGVAWKWAFPGHGHGSRLLCPICDMTGETRTESLPILK
jgi:hypothetical protein